MPHVLDLIVDFVYISLETKDNLHNTDVKTT